MKFGKWLRHVAAAAVAGCMMLSVSMPALAQTWDITGKGNDVNNLRIYRKDDGKQYVGWGWNASESDVQDDDPVITGKSARYVLIDLDGTKGTVRATMKNMENVACSHVQVVNVKGDAELTLEETNKITNSIGTKIGRGTIEGYSYNGEANLTIKGSGSLQLGEAGVEYDSWYKPNCAAIGDLDSLTLESGTVVKAYGSVNTEKITVNGSAKLAIQKADADQPHWLYNKAGEELTFGGQNKNYGSVSYYNYNAADTDEPDHEAPVEQPDTPDTGDVTDTASADGGGAAVGVALGAAAVWGGYEVATRVILNNLLPEGAAIPKTQAELAVLLWNTAGRPEPANAPAFADVDDTTAKAAQWCTEQGYMNGNFKPAKRVTKFSVIRTWNSAFPKN